MINRNSVIIYSFFFLLGVIVEIGSYYLFQIQGSRYIFPYIVFFPNPCYKWPGIDMGGGCIQVIVYRNLFYIIFFYLGIYLMVFSLIVPIFKKIIKNNISFISNKNLKKTTNK